MFVLPQFQSFKFVYAGMLVDAGFTVKALQYVEEISAAVTKSQKSGLQFSPLLLKSLPILEDRLRTLTNTTKSESRVKKIAKGMFGLVGKAFNWVVDDKNEA